LWTATSSAWLATAGHAGGDDRGATGLVRKATAEFRDPAAAVAAGFGQAWKS
jgi:hypothetical protein